jgi:hypothetical protein
MEKSQPMAPEYHDFQASLQRSHGAEDLPLWKELYRQAFPSLLSFHSHRQDGEHQRAGVDRSIVLANARTVLVDEKIRFRNRHTGKVYEDILLEYWSAFDATDPNRCSLGWLFKPLRADYIAYAIAPLGKAYLLPVLLLQAAGRHYQETWWVKYPHVECNSRNAQGRTWKTVSVAVPVTELFRALCRMTVYTFAPTEWTPEGDALCPRI